MSHQINLYDPVLRKQKDWLSSQNVVLASLLVVLVISAGAGVARWTLASRTQQATAVNAQLAAARTAFATMTSSLAGRKADPALVAEIKANERSLQVARNALSLLRGMTGEREQPVVGDMMRAFSRAAVDGLWLTGFVVAEAGRQLEIRGRMADQALLPGYLRRLESEPVFQGRHFSSLDMRGAEWTPPAEAGGAVDQAKTTERKPDRWYVEFALRTTDVPKTGETGGSR